MTIISEHINAKGAGTELLRFFDTSNGLTVIALAFQCLRLANRAVYSRSVAAADGLHLRQVARDHRAVIG